MEIGPERFSLGATVVAVSRRLDSDFLGIGLTENPGYARLDARFRFRVIPGVEAFAVGENLLDHQYMEALGYPALPRALRAGVRVNTADLKGR